MKGIGETFFKIELLVNELLDAPESQREDLLKSRCSGDTALAGAARSMLVAIEAEQRLSALCGKAAHEEQRTRRRRAGPYELDSLLGRGGMGTVYLAHRADGEFEQKVAIKLIDLPLTTELFRDRFRLERQILARLQHPYIARLLDGGVTEDGELYLVMEYVDGLPIHRFCDEHKLSGRQRIALFLRVCEAVQFAHHNLVVHRDLKPDNILVAADGTPRLLDFGTAKLLSPSPEGASGELTRDGYRTYTPQYASPEQVKGDPITTASDTYSLGVLLYLLLTGLLPYEIEELTTAEIARKVCVEPPRKPSQAAATDRRPDADPEAILMKALRKETNERYLTVEQLSTDLCAYLEGRPVAARRGTWRYRAGKFAQRHRPALAAAGVLAVSLVAGASGILWQAKVASQERHKAEARSADLRQLSNSLLTELDTAIQQIPGTTGAQKLLVTRVLEHLDRMARDAQGDRQTQIDLIDAYTRLANLQGNGVYQNHGDLAGALASADKAVTLGTALARSYPKDRDTLRALAFGELSQSQILYQSARLQPAIAATRASIGACDRLIGLPGVRSADLCQAALAYATLGNELGKRYDVSSGDRVGALAAYRRSVDLANEALQVDPESARGRQLLAAGRMTVIELEMETDTAQALRDAKAGLQQLATIPKQEQENLDNIRTRKKLLGLQSMALRELGEHAQASAIAVELVRSYQRLAAADPKDMRAREDLMMFLELEVEAYAAAADPDLGATAESRRQNLTAAEVVWRKQLALLESVPKEFASQDRLKLLKAHVQVALGSAGFILRGGENPTTLARKGLATMRELSRARSDSAMILYVVADSFMSVDPAALRDPQLALSCAERAVELSRHVIPFNLLTLAEAYRATAQIEKCHAAAREGLALLAPVRPGDPKPGLRKLLELQMR